MVSIAKALSSSYLPIGGAMISDEIYQVIKEESGRLGVFGTGYTYSGHPVPAAVALETLKIYEERDTIGHVRSVMPRFQRRLHALFQLRPRLLGLLEEAAVLGAGVLRRLSGLTAAALEDHAPQIGRQRPRSRVALCVTIDHGEGCVNAGRTRSLVRELVIAGLCSLGVAPLQQMSEAAPGLG